MHSPFDLLALLLVLSAGLAVLNCHVLKLPMTVGLLVGAFAGTMGLLGLDAAFPAVGIRHAVQAIVGSIDFPNTLLRGFLAFLLFAGALQVNSADMFARKWTILALAGAGTVLSTVMTAGALLLVSRLFGLGVPLAWCLVFGALISPTDPVSVLDVLRRVGVPPRLQAIFAGESLFNDGVAVVLFTTVLALAVPASGPAASVAGVATLFLVEAVGGALVGLALGWTAFWVLRGVDDYNVELIISLALATGTYSLAGWLGTSGPIAVVAAGILIGNRGMDLAMSEVTRQHLRTFWLLVEEVLNALLFLLIGLEIVAIDLDGRTLLAMVAMIPLVLFIRWLSVAISAVPLNLRLRSFGPLFILTWGGLRGGLSVAMALSLPDGPSKAPILTIAYGIVVFSIVVQGLTLAPLARRLQVR
jgi:CPA1 family monovalent cation:H+ antiporter